MSRFAPRDFLQLAFFRFFLKTQSFEVQQNLVLFGFYCIKTKNPMHRLEKVGFFPPLVNGGCVVVGKPHPSHPCTKPHPAVYESARVVQKRLPMDENLGTWETLLEPSESHMNALIQPVKFHFISKLVSERGLELMANK